MFEVERKPSVLDVPHAFLIEGEVEAIEPPASTAPQQSRRKNFSNRNYFREENRCWGLCWSHGVLHASQASFAQEVTADQRDGCMVYETLCKGVAPGSEANHRLSRQRRLAPTCKKVFDSAEKK